MGPRSKTVFGRTGIGKGRKRGSDRNHRPLQGKDVLTSRVPLQPGNGANGPASRSKTAGRDSPPPHLNLLGRLPIPSDRATPFLTTVDPVRPQLSRLIDPYDTRDEIVLIGSKVWAGGSRFGPRRWGKRWAWSGGKRRGDGVGV
jgi:hypothetical protein